MKYRNMETGVILEPADPEAEIALANDPRYMAMNEKPVKKAKTETRGIAMYVSAEEYIKLSRSHAVLEDQLEQALDEAERDIDSLTFCRVRAVGIDALTDFQQSLVKLAVVQQADFRKQYGEMLENPLASYSVNGVSMSWDKGAVTCASGVYTAPSILALLRQTGLTYRGLRR